MDLAIGAKKTFVMMELLTKSGESKLVPQCTYPLTGIASVHEVAPLGGLDPEAIVTPGVYVKRVVRVPRAPA